MRVSQAGAAAAGAGAATGADAGAGAAVATRASSSRRPVIVDAGMAASREGEILRQRAVIADSVHRA